MIGRLNHVAIATSDIKKAAKVYRDTLGAKVSEEVPQPDHGVTTVFVDLGNTKIELLYPLGDNSPIKGFLDKKPAGGVHHICLEGRTVGVCRCFVSCVPMCVCSIHGTHILLPNPLFQL